MSETAQSIERFRLLRRELEESILPLATSLDGRRFEFQARLDDLQLEVGGYVTLEHGTERRLGQVITLERSEVDGPMLPGAGDGATGMRIRIRAARGHGLVLSGAGPFHDALVRPAEASEVADWLSGVRPKRAALPVGTLGRVADVPFSLDAVGFGRHTFLCGQSGSGKTYSLGVLLERLLLETELRIVILDPNSDYVRLRETRADTAPAESDAYARAAGEIAVRRQGSDEPLLLRLDQLEPRERAALLRLDPLDDRAEYAVLEETLRSGPAFQAELATGDTAAEALRLRAANLGVDSWEIWARGRAGSILDDVAGRTHRALVVDLGSLASREEQAVVAESVLATLWRNRADRAPTLIVIDEAHNVCPAEPDDLVTALATDHAVRIAGEGRKFGLHLLLATQRPQKVHPNVVSQCDNLVLMRMNSTVDLAFVGDVFSFVPQSLLDLATTFVQGEAIVAGPITSHPALLRFGARLSLEGGSDAPADWAGAPRA